MTNILGEFVKCVYVFMYLKLLNMHQEGPTHVNYSRTQLRICLGNCRLHAHTHAHVFTYMSSSNFGQPVGTLAEAAAGPANAPAKTT